MGRERQVPDTQGSASEHNGAGEAGARNIATFRRFIAEGLVKGNIDVINEVLVPDLIDHQDYGPGFPPGRDGVVALEYALLDALPDMASEIQNIVAVGNQTWARIRTTGTFTGSYLGIPGTHKPIDIIVVESVRWTDDGRISEHWGVADRLGLLDDMGLIPPGSMPTWRPEFGHKG